MVRVSDLPVISEIPAKAKAVPFLRSGKAAAAPLAVKDTVTILAPPPVVTPTGIPPFSFNRGWQGLSFAQASGAPPDVSIGVGPNHVVETINTAMAIYDKNGVLQPPGVISLDTFFNVGAFFTFDPKVVFDPESGRFFMVLIGIDEATGTQGRAWFATSNSSDPTGTWTTFILVTEDGTFPDYPGLGFCSDKLVVTANQFDLDPFGIYTGAEFWVINKADLIAGSTTPAMQFFAPDPGVFTIQPAESQSPTNTLFMVATDRNLFTVNHFYEVNGLPNSVTVTVTSLAIADGSFPPEARQMGGPNIDAADDRHLRATFRDGIFWASSTGACTPVGDIAPRACPRFTQIDTSGPTILQDFSYGLVSLDLIWPALQTDASGNLVMLFTRTSSGEFPGLYFAGRLETDPADSASLPMLLKAGERPYDCTFCDPPERWGDYFHAVVDPVDGTLWVAGEYMGSPTSDDYATFIANLIPERPTPTTTTSTTSTTTSTTSTTTSTTSTTTSTTSTTTTTPPPRGANWEHCVWEIEIELI